MTTTVAPARRKTTKCGQCGLKGKHLPECPNAGCEYCGAQVGHQPDCPQYEDERTAARTACGAQLDDEGAVRCTLDAHGEDVPHQSVSATGTVVWPSGGQSDTSQQSFTTTVDGKEAKVVLDGTTGAPAQQELIATPIEDRIRAIGRKEAELDDARRDKKRASDRVKALEEEHELMVRALVAQVDGGEMPLPLSTASDEAEESDDERGEGLTAAERRALAMTQDDQGEDEDEPRKATVPLSTQQAGLYVMAEEGPED